MSFVKENIALDLVALSKLNKFVTATTSGVCASYLDLPPKFVNGCCFSTPKFFTPYQYVNLLRINHLSLNFGNVKWSCWLSGGMKSYSWALLLVEIYKKSPDWFSVRGHSNAHISGVI